MNYSKAFSSADAPAPVLPLPGKQAYGSCYNGNPHEFNQEPIYVKEVVVRLQKQMALNRSTFFSLKKHCVGHGVLHYKYAWTSMEYNNGSNWEKKCFKVKPSPGG